MSLPYCMVDAGFPFGDEATVAADAADADAAVTAVVDVVFVTENR